MSQHFNCFNAGFLLNVHSMNMNDIAAFTSTSASRGLFRRVLPAGLAVLVSLFAGPLRAVEAEIRLRLDYASIVRLPERTASIVIGNPVILDATLQRGGTAVLTGHGYGTTNIIFQDGGGAILEERTVLIVPPTQNLITVQRGNERET